MLQGEVSELYCCNRVINFKIVCSKMIVGICHSTFSRQLKPNTHTMNWFGSQLRFSRIIRGFDFRLNWIFFI